MRRLAVVRVEPARVRGGTLQSDGTVEWVSERRRTEGLTFKEAMEVLLARTEFRRCRAVRVELESEQVQLRTLRGLPPVPEAELSDLVREGASRFFRMNGRSLVTAAAWLTTDTDDVVARAAAAPEALLLGIEDVVEGTGRALEGVRPIGAEGCEGLVLESRPRAERRKRFRRRKTAGLVAAALVPWLVAAGIYGWDAWRDRAALASEARALSSATQQVESIGQALARFRPVHEAVREGTDGWAMEALGRVTGALPASCHLLSFRATRSGGLRMEADCTDPVAMLTALEHEGLTSVGFETPPPETGGLMTLRARWAP